MDVIQFIAERFNYWIVIILMMTGLYTVIARGNLVKKVIGLNIFQTSVFIYYITIGKVSGGTAPIYLPGDMEARTDHGGGHSGGHGDGHDGGAHGGAENGADIVDHGNDARLHHSDVAGGGPENISLLDGPSRASSVSGGPGGIEHTDITNTGITNTGITNADITNAGGTSAASLHADHGVSNDLLAQEAAQEAAQGVSQAHEALALRLTDPSAPATGGGTHAGLERVVGAAGEVVYSNPLPHVLILTAIVVGVATTAVGLALAVRIREAYGTIEEDELEAADNIAEFGVVDPVAAEVSS